MKFVSGVRNVNVMSVLLDSVVVVVVVVLFVILHVAG